MKALLAVLCLGASIAGPIPARQQAPAQEEEPLERLELRVSGTRGPSEVVVDRGASDGLEVGDRVLFRPREGGTFAGAVLTAENRSSVVELDDPDLRLAPGTRGEALVPAGRLAELRRPAQRPDPERRVAPWVPEHPPWENTDEGWTPDQPLLAEVGAVRPEERAPQWTARAYSIADVTAATEDDRYDGFFRTGTDVRVENPFGRGGGLHVDGEFNYRITDVEGQVDEGETNLRLDRASYYWGGTRFDPERWEAGRFLLKGMPEFGVIDGVEYVRRLPNGDSVGGSMGFMPEPNADYESGKDFQLSAYYRWVADASERLSASGGFQKTLHNGTRDRDLFVAKVSYLPALGWDLLATAWVDLYDSRDDAKGSGVELTQAYASASRRWESGNGVRVTYSHLRFPEIEREEFLPVQDAQLANDRNDRLAVGGWRMIGDGRRLRGTLGGWTDEDDSGGDVELGIDVDDLWRERSRAGATLFGTVGRFETVLGARVSYAWEAENGRWYAAYELSNHDQAGFADNNDDIVQHWLRASRDLHLASGWDLSLSGQTRIWDDEGSLSLGVFVQKVF